MGAYVPDLPGCVAAGESREEVLSLIREAIALHLEGLKEQFNPFRLLPPQAITSKSYNNVLRADKPNRGEPLKENLWSRTPLIMPLDLHKNSDNSPTAISH
jgi:predicted RNase H-like HicB family nuclease